MFSWICPQCGREVGPAYTECPDCSAKARAGAPAGSAPAGAKPAAPPAYAQPAAPAYPQGPPPPPYPPQGGYPPPQQPGYPPQGAYPVQPGYPYPPPPGGYPPPPGYPAQGPPAYPPPPQAAYPYAPPPPFYPPEPQAPPPAAYPPAPDPAAYAPPPAYPPPPEPPSYAPPPQPAAYPPPEPPAPPPPQETAGAASPAFTPQYVARPQRAAMPTWLMTILFAVGFVIIVGGLYYLLGNSHGSPTAGAPPTNVENPAAKPGAPVSPFQKYVEVSGVRFTEDAKKNIVVKCMITNHSDQDMTGLGGNVTIWGRTRKSEEDAVGTFSFSTDVGAQTSKEITAPLTTKLKIYELPDWQNVTTDLQITAPQP